jgi:Cu(I)/Ag(I) efflux system membrane protein CusA/SilA
MEELKYEQTPEQQSWIGRILGFCIYNKLVVGLITLFIIGWGIYVAPFDWTLGGLLRNPVAVDAIPDIGENQQIVFTEWPGRSPQDVEDQITYPLTTALLGIPDIKVIRSNSMFGFSSIYVVFRDFTFYEKLIGGKDFYWTRSRILEKLNSLPAGTLPSGVTPMMGPDATALGQIFWYTLEGRDPQGGAAVQYRCRGPDDRTESGRVSGTRHRIYQVGCGYRGCGHPGQRQRSRPDQTCGQSDLGAADPHGSAG